MFPRPRVTRNQHAAARPRLTDGEIRISKITLINDTAFQEFPEAFPICILNIIKRVTFGVNISRLLADKYNALNKEMCVV